MNLQPGMTQEEYLLLDEFCSNRFGLSFPEHKKEILESRLRPRLQANKLKHFMDYYLLLQYSSDSSEELRRFVEAVTNNETYFFREMHQVRALFDDGWPLITEAPVLPNTVRILCSACSSGEEAYTINICARESMPAASPFKVEIDAFDIDASRLAIALQGEYAQTSLRTLTPEQVIRYFTVTSPERYQLRPFFREGIRFAEGNLMDLATFKRPILYDVIFCRNVLIYFS